MFIVVVCVCARFLIFDNLSWQVASDQWTSVIAWQIFISRYCCTLVSALEAGNGDAWSEGQDSLGQDGRVLPENGRGECPVFRNGWLLWMRQVNVETLEFGFQAAMNKYKRLSYWKFVMKVLNCVLVNIDSVLIKWLFDEVWSQVVILLGIWGKKPCRHSHCQFSCHLPGRFGNVLPASMWIKGLIISKSDSWLDCAAPHGVWFDMITEFQIIIEAFIWSLICTCYETSGPDFDSILT